VRVLCLCLKLCGDVLNYYMIKKYIIPFIVLVILLYRLPVSNFRLSYELLALYGSVGVFSFYLIQKTHIILGCFLLLCTFASMYPLCTLTSINSLRYIVVGVVLYYAIYELNVNKESIYNVLCIYCLTHIAFIITAKFSIDLYLIYGINSNCINTGLAANINETSALIALCTPAFLRAKWCWGLPICFAGLVLAGALGGFLSFLIIILAFFMLRGEYFRGLVLCVVILAAGLRLSHNLSIPGVSTRLGIWVDALKFYFKTGTVTGWGLGHWASIAKKYLPYTVNGQYWSRAHNTFIQCFCELGMPFLILLGFYVKSLISKAKDNEIFVYALIAIFVSCSVNSAFRINALNGFIIILWLAIIGRGDDNTTNQNI